MTQGYAKAMLTDQIAPAPTGWVRPPEWLAMPTVNSGDQKICILFAVFEGVQNWFTINVAGAYSIDYGDGAGATNVASGTTSSKVLAWADYASSPLTAEGARQALITVTMQAANNLTSVSFNNKHASAGSASYCDGLLDIVMAGSNLSSLTLGNASGFTHNRLQRFKYVGTHALTTMANGLKLLANLRSVEMAVASITSFAATFDTCSTLVEVTLTGSTAAVTAWNSAFTNCGCLSTLNATFDMTSCTNALSMFNGCSKLTSVTLSNTASVTTFNAAFNGCANLTSMTLDMTACTDATSMFNACLRLTAVTLTNTGSVTTWANAFAGCVSLTAGPTLTTTPATNMSAMFQGCTSLASIPTYSTANVTNWASFLASCGALITVPALNQAAGTSFANVVQNCSSLQSYLATGARFNISMPAANQLNAAALDAMYTALGTASGSQTVTVTGSPGITGDTPSIATSKGWTVSGS